MTALADALHTGRLSLKNRLAKAAMSERLAGIGTERGAPTDALVALYRRWATSGAGLLITGNAMIDGRARGEVGNVVIEDDSRLAGLRAWASAAKAGGAQVFVQLNHPGRQAPRGINRELVAPSAIAVRGGGMFARPRALEEREIEELIARFARAAALVLSAGFDGVQLHGAHGYLISQFLSPLANQRSDGWGGDARRRSRFLFEVIAAVRGVVGDRFPIALKLNSADFQRGGFTQEESMDVVAQLESAGVDLLEISGGTYEAAAMMGSGLPARASTRAREAYFLEYAEQVRARTRVPLMLTGGFRTRAGMDQALASGAIDVVGLARPLVLEPELGVRLLADRDARVSSPRLSSGVKQLDGLLQTAWHGAQLARLGAGLDPDPELGKLRALAHYVGIGSLGRVDSGEAVTAR